MQHRAAAIDNREEHWLKDDTVLVLGRARLPDSLSSRHNSGFYIIELGIDPKTAQILNFSCNINAFLVVQMLQDALLGRGIEEGIRDAIVQIEKRVFSMGKRTVIAALEDTGKVYKNIYKITTP